MRYAIGLATWLAALGVVSCGDSEPSNGTNTGGSGGTGSGGSGGASGTDGGSSDSSGVSAEQACTATANALCSKYETCAPYVLVLLGDVDACITVAKSACLGSLQADKTAATAAGFLKCSQDLDAATCADILAHKPPLSCQPKGGTVGNGMACGDDWQCTSGHCNIPDNATCGVCADLAKGGAACPNKTDDDCEFGLICSGSMVCVVPGVAGASCDGSHPCANSLVCSGATLDGGLGTCAPGGALGAPCAGDQSCSLIDGLWCTREANRTCAKIGAADPGMPCGLLGLGEYTLCRGGGSGGGCNVVAGMVKGTCPRLALPGETCSATTPCKAGAQCVNGLCTVREPAACR